MAWVPSTTGQAHSPRLLELPRANQSEAHRWAGTIEGEPKRMHLGLEAVCQLLPPSQRANLRNSGCCSLPPFLSLEFTSWPSFGGVRLEARPGPCLLRRPLISRHDLEGSLGGVLIETALRVAAILSPAEDQTYWGTFQLLMQSTYCAVPYHGSHVTRVSLRNRLAGTIRGLAPSAIPNPANPRNDLVCWLCRACPILVWEMLRAPSLNDGSNAADAIVVQP
jgi:hypothetical protein